MSRISSILAVVIPRFATIARVSGAILEADWRSAYGVAATAMVASILSGSPDSRLYPSISTSEPRQSLS